MTTYEFLMTQNQLTSILDNDNFENTIFNLYDRWQDEHGYEDIKDYAKPLENIVSRIIGKDIVYIFINSIKNLLFLKINNR